MTGPNLYHVAGSGIFVVSAASTEVSRWLARKRVVSLIVCPATAVLPPLGYNEDAHVRLNPKASAAV